MEIGIVSGEINDEDQVVAYVAMALKMPREMVRLMIDYDHPDWYTPIGDVAKTDIEGIYGTLQNLGGVRLTTTMMRYYFGGGIGSHVIGYTQQPSAETKADYQAMGYAGDERVGASGLEYWGEQYLAGRQGGQLWVTSPTGSNLAMLAQSKPQAAMAIYTTLDRDLQQQMEQTLMGPFTGAAVVLNRNTGEVLAMMSSPGYDSNLFDPNSTNGTFNNGALVQSIINDARHPLVNRATRGLYPLGSVFKIITMAAGLESGLFKPDSVYNDLNGYFTELDGFTGTDWTIEKDMKPHGKVTLEQCLERSCNPCFWHVGLTLYYKDAWLVPNMAMAFGLGSETGITGVEEEAGLVPNPGWKHDTQNGSDWTGGDALNQAIGQGSLQVTPLQVADFVAAVGNGGTLFRPQIILSIRPPIGETVLTFKPEVRGKLPVSPGEPGRDPDRDDGGGEQRQGNRAAPLLRNLRHHPDRRQDRHRPDDRIRPSEFVVCRLLVQREAEQTGYRRGRDRRTDRRRIHLRGSDGAADLRNLLPGPPDLVLSVGIRIRDAGNGHVGSDRRADPDTGSQPVTAAGAGDHAVSTSGLEQDGPSKRLGSARRSGVPGCSPLGGAAALLSWLKPWQAVLPGSTPAPLLSETGIPHPPSPEGAARAFLDGWQSADYPKMYSLLADAKPDCDAAG